MTILDQLREPKGPYKLKGVGSPEYYLGGDVKIKYKGEIIEYLETSAKTYIKRVTDKIESLMEWKLKHYTSPEDPDYHPEVDETPFLVGEDVAKYRMLVGSLNWLITLGRYDVHHSCVTLARYMMIPREGHLNTIKESLVI